MIIAKKEEINKMFQKNISLLSPWLRETVLNIDEKKLWEKININYNSEGFPICKYIQDNRKFQITSTKPVQEAKQWSRTVKVKGTGVIFMYGSGFGYSLFELFKIKQPHTLVVLFEQDIYLFAAMLYYFDFREIIDTKKISMLIGDSKNFAKAFDNLFFSITLINSTSPVLAFTNIARRNFKNQYNKIHQYVFKQLGLFVFYIGNDHLDNLIGLHNLLANINEIVTNPYITCIKDTFKEVPAFIIANGPSLDKNIHFLKEIKEKGLIICGESAIIPLMKNNIKPDILTIVERSIYTYFYHFEDIDYPKDMALLCLGLVDKHVYPCFPGAKIPIFRKSEFINEWINSYVGDKSALNAGANVSHLAFELAVYLGANPIVFVGQDYAYGKEGVTHSKDALYLKEKGKRARDILKSKPTVYVESNEGEMIPSIQLWVDFKQGLEGKIATNSDKILINATEGGAKIHGTEYMKLKDVIDKYCKEQMPYKVFELINNSKANISIKERKEGLEKFIKSVEKYGKEFRELSKKANEGKFSCRQMMRLAKDSNNHEYREILEKSYRNNIDTFQQFIEDELYRCFSQQIIFVFYYLMNSLGLIDTQDKIIEIFKIQRDFFNHLNIVFQSIAVHLEDAIKPLKDLLNELDNID
ncbi:DUF115 domain-containing protein [Clostridiaceae bacterium M8S5]|nr:DUF115 domain-containing protein [Clostridiaceae bacterium M8S5]